MKKSFQKTFIVILPAILILILTSFTVTNKTKFNNDKYDVLLQKIDSLSTRVAKLEKQVKKLEDQNFVYKYPSPQYPMPYGKIPPGTKKYWYKGVPYYFMPLQYEAQSKEIKIKKK